ncbi:hypothetical protein AHAS_Ahas12G0085900 [Arachis hypogaea]
MQARAAATNQAIERMNGNGNGSGGSPVESPMTLATFLKVNLSTFRRSANPMEADNWFIELQAQHVSEG